MEGVQGKKKEVCLNTIKQQKELALTSLYLLNGLLDGDVQLLTSAELAVQTYYNLFTFEKNCELKATAKRVLGSFGNLANVGAVVQANLPTLSKDTVDLFTGILTVKEGAKAGRACGEIIFLLLSLN